MITKADLPSFEEMLARHQLRAPIRGPVTTLQANLGRLCNMSCGHCHVGAGPARPEMMTRATATRVLQLVEASADVGVVDLTGGAPELNPSFRYLVDGARGLQREVIDRCNLTVLLEPGMEDLPDFLASRQVRVVASLPCYLEQNVDQQRGDAAFQRSIEALRQLNARGYGQPGSDLQLDLVYNPLGAFLPPPQRDLEADYRTQLGRRSGVVFDRLLTITNMPINRFAARLRQLGELDRYLELLVTSFNRCTVEGLMCRSLVSVGWDGRLFDCDFNQVLGLPITARQSNEPLTISELQRLDQLAGDDVVTASHCFGCTAGAGSSCGGALD